jgi:hypothetical protein
MASIGMLRGDHLEHPPKKEPGENAGLKLRGGVESMQKTKTVSTQSSAISDFAGSHAGGLPVLGGRADHDPVPEHR